MRSFRFGLSTLFLTIVVTAITCVVFRAVQNERRSQLIISQQFNVTRMLRQLWIAVDNYVQKHGRLPYNEHGMEYALYELRQSLPLEVFDTLPNQGASPRWDSDSRALQNSDIIYLNRQLRFGDPEYVSSTVIAISPLPADLEHFKTVSLDGTINVISREAVDGLLCESR
jgi:hypothetical protein